MLGPQTKRRRLAPAARGGIPDGRLSTHWRTGTRGGTRRPAGSRPRSCAGRRSSGRSPAPCTKTAPAARARTPCTAGARTRAPGSHRSGSHGTLPPRRQAAARRPPAAGSSRGRRRGARRSQHRVLGVARPVVADAARHSGDIGAPRERPQCPAMDTPQRWGQQREGPRVLGVRGDTSCRTSTRTSRRRAARRLVFGDGEGSARSADGSRAPAVDAAPR